jgi:hypothetical protein
MPASQANSGRAERRLVPRAALHHTNLTRSVFGSHTAFLNPARYDMVAI